MTRDQAGRESERLSREHPDRAGYRWFARQVGGFWSVVRVSLPPSAADQLTRANTSRA